MSVAIIIPTKNRPQFLARQLAYYSEVGCDGTIFVGDSSDGQYVESTPQVVSKFAGRTKIEHFPLPDLNANNAIKKIAQRVEDPYVVLASDDDFLIPGTLADCAEFLDSNPDYSSAGGIGLSFAVAQDWSIGEFVRTKLEPQRPSEDTNGRLRLLEFLSSSWPTRFCVQRTAEFRDAAAFAASPPDKEFRQLLASCIPIIRGKSKQLGRLFSLRQAHIQYYPMAYACDWITDPEWFESYDYALENI